MSNTTIDQSDLQVSKLAQHIIGSEIIKLAGEVNEKIKQGEHIFNFTIGGFPISTIDQSDLQVSKLAQHIIGSEIIKLAGEVNEKIKQGEHIFNLTIGDFNPKVLPNTKTIKPIILLPTVCSSCVTAFRVC